jgi:hypothetical protein
MIQFILGGAGLFLGRNMGKSEADKEFDEKLDVLKNVAGLTPDQALAVDALKKMPISEVRERRRLGIGLTRPMPEQAKGLAVGHITVSQEEKSAVANSEDQKAAIKALVDQKMQERAKWLAVGHISQEEAIKALVDQKMREIGKV